MNREPGKRPLIFPADFLSSIDQHIKEAQREMPPERRGNRVIKGVWRTAVFHPHPCTPIIKPRVVFEVAVKLTRRLLRHQVHKEAPTRGGREGGGGGGVAAGWCLVLID